MINKAILVLEDGKVFSGNAFGFTGESIGEVVFNTSHTGYQEILTDASYKGQIVTMTYPHMGNYGINQKDFESIKPYVSGFICKEYSKIYSNWRAGQSLGDFLKENKIVGIEDIDTRALVKLIREKGSLKGIISSINFDIEILLKKVRSSQNIVGIDLVKEVSCQKIYEFNDKLPEEDIVINNLSDKRTKIVKNKKVVVIDCGVKLNILRALNSFGLKPIIVPAKTSFEKILSLKPDGVLISNGPGDPEGVPYVINTVKKLVMESEKTLLPIMGICLGHQILGLAMGGKTYKLRFGHHGGNQPIKNLNTNRVEICAENHNFALRMEKRNGNKWTIDGNDSFIMTHINLNDGTAEGMVHKKLPIFSVQFHPEASPGPHDSRYLFEKFKKNICQKEMI